VSQIKIFHHGINTSYKLLHNKYAAMYNNKVTTIILNFLKFKIIDTNAVMNKIKCNVLTINNEYEIRSFKQQFV